MHSSVRHLIVTVLLGLALSGVALAVPQRLAPEPTPALRSQSSISGARQASVRNVYSHAQPAASIVRDSRAPTDWRAALVILICVYTASFGLVRGMFGTAGSRASAIRIT